MKIENNVSVKDLKQEADKLWLEYKPNATTAQMQELLKKTPNTESTTISNTDLKTLLKEIADLKEQVNATWDTNKIRDFERSKEVLNNFAFSLKLFPTRDWNLPIIKWETITNFVWKDTKEDDQVIEITYLKEWKEEKEELKLWLFATFLKRSEKIVAKSINNLDGSDVYISKQINPETKLEYYMMNPKDQTISVTLDYNKQELTILSTYLNA